MCSRSQFTCGSGLFLTQDSQGWRPVMTVASPCSRTKRKCLRRQRVHGCPLCKCSGDMAWACSRWTAASNRTWLTLKGTSLSAICGRLSFMLPRSRRIERLDNHVNWKVIMRSIIAGHRYWSFETVWILFHPLASPRLTSLPSPPLSSPPFASVPFSSLLLPSPPFSSPSIMVVIITLTLKAGGKVINVS